MLGISGCSGKTNKKIYLKHDIFTEGTLDGIIQYLRQFNDEHLRDEIKDNPEKLMQQVTKYFHCG